MAIGILFVCTGNICRSPMAAGVFRTMAQRAGMAETFIIDSAGTYDGHVGAPASLLAVEAARRRGYDISGHRSRVVTNEDLEKFDLPLAMDRSHLAAMHWMASRERQHRATLLMKFAPQLGVEEVADPYGGPAAGYEEALNLIEAACKGLLVGFQTELKASKPG